MRYFLKLAYNGTDFHGWQMQQGASSIQEEISTHISTILRQKISIMGCGRTDAGVHASQFYAHFDLDSKIELPYDLLVHKLNTMLHSNIAIQEILEVKDDAHARFDATKRTYKYIITRVKDPFHSDLCYKLNVELDLQKMNKACELLLGEHDFGCFCKAQTQNHTNICTVHEAFWVQKEEQVIFQISANRFLRNMVRAVVGTMLEIGRGKTEVEELKQIIESKSRSEAGRSVPAHGLYLTHVEYPSEIFLKTS